MQIPRAAPFAGALASLMLIACSKGSAPATPGANDVSVHDAWVRLPPPGAPVAGGYMTVRNAGDIEDRLISASTPYAASVEIHDMEMSGGMTQMRQLADGLKLPPRSEVRLAPSGLHLMLITPGKELASATEVPITLIFEHSGARTVAYQVRTMTGEVPAGAHANQPDDTDPHVDH